MTKKIFIFVLISIFMLTTLGAFARNITLRNNGSGTLTIRYAGSSGSASWSIGAGGSVVHSVPDGTSAMRYWADTGANAPPCNTLAEFTLNGAGNLDFYDVSLVDGFNVAAQIVPSGGSGDGSYYSCGIAGCTSTALLTGCPSELQSQGACCSACMIFGSPQYCCSGAYNTPATCPPTSYSNWFKATCPDAYSYAYDDTTSTYTCTGASYTINFAGAGSTGGGGGTTATPTPTPASGGGGTTSYNPGSRIEAENYSAMAGIQTEACSEGGSNVGWIDAGDWMAYNGCNFPSTGTYTFSFRVASQSTGGTISVDLDGGATVIGSVSFGATGGWQTWTTVTMSANVPVSGVHALGVFASTGGWNLNWLSYAGGSSGGGTSATATPQPASTPTPASANPTPTRRSGRR